MRSITFSMALALVACGGPAPVGSDACSGCGDGGHDGDGGAPHDAGTPMMDAGSLPLAGSGAVFAMHQPGSTSITASFTRSTDGTDGCLERVVEGACRYERCPPPGTPMPASAGVITVTTSLTSVPLTPEADGTYAPPAAPAMLWSDGETLHISAAGDEVPAFDEAFTAPSEVTITSPDLTAFGALMSDRPLTVEWTGTSAGAVVVAVIRGDQQVKCSFDPAAGSGSVPASMMSLLTPGGASVAIVAEDYRVERIGDWSIRFAVRTVATQNGTAAIISTPLM